MTDKLPPLPEPRTLSRGDADGEIQLGYTAAQMHAYAIAAVMAERERAAKIVEHFNGWVESREVAAAIRQPAAPMEAT